MEPLPLAQTEKMDAVYRRAPLEVVQNFPVYVADLRPGEILYFPSDWIHMVYTLEDSVAAVFYVPIIYESGAPRPTRGRLTHYSEL